MAKPQQILKLEKVIGKEIGEVHNEEDFSGEYKTKQILNMQLEESELTKLFHSQIKDPLNYYKLNKNREIIKLSLSNFNLKYIYFLNDYQDLEELFLYNNQIIDITPIEKLTKLTKINFGLNQISDITPLRKLTNLTQIILEDNRLTDLPIWILGFNLDIKWKFGVFGNNGIYVSGNPLKSPPPEIIKQGTYAIQAYFDSLKELQRPLNELKVLFVGDGSAGKTSLSKVLRGETFNPQESQTHGINIDHWQHQDFTLHFWDFGGQETMHATHQFFLSKRSLYILVLDGRKEEDAEYWLKHIESFGGDSPVLIVLNKIDEHPSFDVNRKHLLDKYQGIVGFYKLSCDTQQGLDEFKQAFIKAFDTVEMLQTVWGESWLNIKQALEGWQHPMISAGDYRKLCHDQRVTDPQTQDILAQFLNDLGVVVYFADLDLNDTHVLEPRWITEAVYKIINAQQLAIKKGVLCLQELAEILKPVTAEDYQYPPEKHRHIIELMKKFELCYELDKRHILIPDLLDIQEPEFSFADKQPLRFRLEYDFLPKSIMPRFIVKRHADIKDSLRWRTGVVLYDKNTDATAIIRADDRERLIDIQVGGKQKRDYFAVIRGTLNDIHASFQKLTITELVPLPDNPTICLEYQELIGYELDGRDEYFVGKLRKAYSVSQLLNGIEKPENRHNGGSMIKKKIFLASSAELKADREQFEIFINRKNKVLFDKGVFLELVLWEDFLDTMSGTRLQDEYNKAVQECDIFVMLFFTKVGKYTSEEFKTAFGEFSANKKPKIFTYFKDSSISSGELSRDDVLSLLDFKDTLKNLGHFPTVYKNIDDLKHKFSDQLEKLSSFLGCI